MSSAKARLSPSSVMALPPYLMTTVWPAYSASQGSASMRVEALAMSSGCSWVWVRMII